jgi:MoaA/NifB/PqqE/SkfB family radical SAM enzyme
MDAGKIKCLLNEIIRLGIPKINFFGGEPLLVFPKLIELVEYANNKGLNASIDTNGILLTRDTVKQLKRAGINNINISLDSADREVHDGLRGFKGTFDSALNAIEACVKEGIPCVISTYASKRAIYSGDLEKIIKIGRKYKATAVKILFPIVSGKWMHSPSESLDKRERSVVYGLLDPGFVYLESLLYSIKSGRKICECLNKKMIYVSPSGEIQPCSAVPVSFGNVNKEPLGKLLNRMWGSKLYSNTKYNHDCIMNNKYFREEHFSQIKDSDNFPVKYESIFK